MKHAEYDVQISGIPLQEVGTVSTLSEHHANPDRYTASFTASRLKSKLGSLDDNELSLVGSEFSALPIIEGTTATLTDLGDDFAQTRGQSRTEVQFAQLVLEGETAGQKADIVAVKYNDPIHAAREFAAMCAVNAVIAHPYAQSSFRPLGFVQSADKSQPKRPVIGLITRYEHEVLTLDRVFWDREHMPTELEAQHALGCAAVWMARLHEHGIAHGDAQAKNIAEGNVSAPRYIDLEDAINLRNQKKQIDKDLAYCRVRDDIETFLTRLEGDYTDIIPRYFAKPYVQHMQQAQKAHIGEITEAEIIEIAQEPQKPIARFGKYL